MRITLDTGRYYTIHDSMVHGSMSPTAIQSTGELMWKDLNSTFVATFMSLNISRSLVWKAFLPDKLLWACPWDKL